MMIHRCGFRPLVSAFGILRVLNQQKLRICLVVTFILVLTGLFGITRAVQAEGSGRFTTVEKKMEANHWYLTSWKEGVSRTLCNIYIVDDHQPNAQDILNYCGEDLEKKWLDTPVCQQAAKGGDASTCDGLYYWYGGRALATVKETVELPKATIRVDIGNCQPGSWCNDRPTLRFYGTEPLPDHKIEEIDVRYGESARSCSDTACEMRMPFTDETGATIEYWAVSDYGDESDHQFLTFRNVKSTAAEPQYQLDLLDEAWKQYLTPGALTWKVFPLMDDPLLKEVNQPKSAEEMQTEKPLQYLAGRLIFAGKVDTKVCQGSGISSNGMATSCGLDASRDQVNSWQNKYDEQIYQASMEYNVPARILKAIITQETQFWPHGNPAREWGFGRITDNGADMLMSWNTPYYDQVCAQIFDEEYCAKGYNNMTASEQSLLRGTSILKVGTDDEFRLLAATLQASMVQVDQMIININGSDNLNGATFDDLWKMTIANYHSGSGCVGTAMQKNKDLKQTMTWDQVKTSLLGDCQGAVNYVDQVLQLAQ
jgi:hypothetical protein